MTGFMQMMAKDAKVILRHRMLLVILLLYPFVFMAIIGLTFSENRDLRLGVVYEGAAGTASAGGKIWIEGEPYDERGLVERFLGEIASIEEYPDSAAAEDALRAGQVDAVLVVPADFVQRMQTLYDSATVQVIIDQSNLFQAASSETSVRGALSRINRILVEEKLRAVNAGLEVLVSGGDFFGNPVIGMREVVANLETVKAALSDPELQAKLEEELVLARTLIEDLGQSADYLRGTAMPLEVKIDGVAGRSLGLNETVVPLLLGLSTLWTGILCAAILLSMEEEEGMRRRLRLTRMHDFTFISAKAAFAFVIVFLQSLIMCLIALVIYPSLASNVFLSLLVVSLTAFSSIGIGILIAAATREVSSAIIISVLVSFPVIFLSGAIFPLNQMPGYMRVIARLIPFTWAFDTLNGVMLRGDPFSLVLRNLLVIVAWGLGLLLLGAWLVRRND
jgi:ABC-type polysaccharide/polyol phosphate export permease